MSGIIVFAGTTEGRSLSEWLCAQKEKHTICVATEYGEQVLTENPYAFVHQSRMDEEEMAAFFEKEHAQIIVDATHPYAAAVTRNIRLAAEQTQKQYIRLLRRTGTDETHACLTFPDVEACADYLQKTEGNILLTTGSKELGSFCSREPLKERLIVRVLPGKESIALCEQQQIPGKRIIAMQGPFSEEMNLALIHQYQAAWLVTKASGRAGGFEEKLSAAEKAGIKACVILPEVQEEKGYTLEEVYQQLKCYLGRDALTMSFAISLIGCGMGRKQCLTLEAAEALHNAELVFGARRLLADMEISQESYPYYLAKDILPVLIEKKKPAAILFSGDSGFYSGAKKIYEALKEAEEKGTLSADIRIYPGISSVSALAAAAGISWEDAQILSVHGKGPSAGWKQQVLTAVRSHRKTFVLLSGVEDLRAIGKLLMQEPASERYHVIAGYAMSSSQEEIRFLTAEECSGLSKEGLYSIFILNDAPGKPVITHGLPDEAFLRAKVPMTKEEVREVSISKLRLKADSVVWDVGSGTGSIAVEIGRLSSDMTVCAIERKPEAVELIRANADRFGLSNIRIVEAEAPEGLEALPEPTHAFIGGSGGRLKEILSAIFRANPACRVVVNAVSFETLQELLTIEKEFPVQNFEIISLAATRTRVLGHYHMLQGENPVWICSMEGKKE